jgi:aminopeptidase-like protein
MKNNDDFGEKLYSLMVKLYPICRSITGDGVRDTLEIIKEIIPIEIKEVPTGKKVFDWTVPKEWNIKDAFIKNSSGEKIVDFKKSNLHVLNYSHPVHIKIRLDELKDHLYSLSDYPDWVPYLTSYYQENWGFCITDKQLKSLDDDVYEVFIGAELKDGFLTYGEFFIKGKADEEVLFSTYLCHPSLCNDNLSGVVLTTFLGKYLKNKDLKYSYRFLFIPETIGAITWLSLNEKNVSKIKYGLVVTCVGDPGKLTYKKTRDGDHVIDEIVERVLVESGCEYVILDFFPEGSDERQYCSPGFNLPIGSLMRTPYGRFPEYHTSADNLDFVKPEFLGDTFDKYLKVVGLIEETDISVVGKKRDSKKKKDAYINLNPKCEPQLGKIGLYKLIGSSKDKDVEKSAMLWILNLSDGTNTLQDISDRSGLGFEIVKKVADRLLEKGLLN